MNYHQDELTAQYNRQRVREDANLIRLENRAAHAKADHASLFTMTMHHISIWMISTGKNLHKRYDLPVTHSHRSPSGSFAH
jgi:hypothetical protein